MSYSHLRGCWFSEMPQVRCHVHRSPGSKLRPLCFPWHAPSSTLPPSLSISFHTNTPSCDFIFPSFSVRCGAAVPSPVKPNKVRPALFIISNNRAITQVLIRAAALYESHPALAVRVREAGPGNAHLIISELRFQVGERIDESLRRNHKVQARQRGVNNDNVCEMTEVCSFLGVGGPHRGRIDACRLS